MCVVGLGLGATAWTQQAPASGQTAPQGQNTSSCRLVKDAYGNLVLDPSCPALVLPANPANQPAPPPNQAPAAPQAPAAQRFPYPGEAPSAPAAPGAAAPSAATPGGAAAQAPADAPAAKRFPYPGETPPSDAAGSSSSSSGSSSSGGAEPADDGAKPVPGQPPLHDAGSSGESSGSSDSSSGKDASGAGAGEPDGDPPDAGTPHRRTLRRKLPPVSAKSTSEQEQEDVQVAGFYQNDGNFRGAYERAKEAVSLDKQDAAAHLALAESARHLGKLDEAELEYKACLGLDPLPKVRRVAERALKEMTGGG